MPVSPVRLRNLIQAFLPDYLHLIDPDAAEDLDLGRLTVLRHRLKTCVAAETVTRGGESVTVLVQVEPGPLFRKELSRRVTELVQAFDLRLGRPVLPSLLLLSGGAPGINLDTATLCPLAGFDTVRINVTLFGLAKARGEYFLSHPRPLAWALAPLMDPYTQKREALTRACLDRIRSADLERKQRRILARWVRGLGRTSV
jgi:hypothetical protein